MLHIKFGFHLNKRFQGKRPLNITVIYILPGVGADPRYQEAVSGKKIFQYYGNIHVHCPMVGVDEPLVSNFFENHLNSVLLLISCKIFPLNDKLTVFPIQMLFVF